MSLLISQPAYTAAGVQKPRRVAQAVGRYALATLAWYLTTQWCFGPAVIDRGFVITGGGCGGSTGGGGDGGGDGLKGLLSSAACKAAGGRWSGGHDVSGHVFMLVLVTAVLGFEGVGARVGGEDGGEKVKEKEDDDVVRKWAGRFVGVVFGLSWWMLLMTAIWFHTWLEKVSFPLLSFVYVVVFHGWFMANVGTVEWAFPRPGHGLFDLYLASTGWGVEGCGGCSGSIDDIHGYGFVLVAFVYIHKTDRLID